MPFASNGDCRIYWRADGARGNPPLLLLNSIGTDLALWDRVVGLLSGQFFVLRMDCRGHGASDAPCGPYTLELLAADARAVLDAAHVPAAVICGLSLGGMIAMTLALVAPERVTALILACTSAKMDSAAWQQRHDKVLAGGTAAIVELVLQRFFSDTYRRLHPGEVETVQTGLLDMNAAGYAGCCAAIRDMQLLEELPKVRAPTLAIAGARDLSTPFKEHGALIVGAIPGARAVHLDAGHLACIEAPGAFAGAIIEFIDEIRNGSRLRAAADTLYEAGLKNRRAVLGDAWVDEALAKRSAFDADFQHFITRYAWHEIWGRPGLDRRTRRLLVLAITAAIGRWEEFRLHLRSGLQQGGFTLDEVQETLMQTAIYAGVPAANTAFAEAAEILRELGREGG